MTKALIVSTALVGSLVFTMTGGCGYSSTDNELIAQPKKVFHQTPIVCPNRNDVDVSLGVMRGGVGSMSVADMMLTVNNPKDVATLEKAIADGKLVKIRYNEFRLALCQEDNDLTSVEIVDGVAKTEDQKKSETIDALEKQLRDLKGKD